MIVPLFRLLDSSVWQATEMSLPNIVLTGPPEMAEDHQIFGTGGPLGQCSKKLISNPV